MKKTNYNIVFLRFLAIIIVVFGHSIIIYDPNWALFSSVYSPSFLIKIKWVINNIQMPIWFSIAGFLFYKAKQKSFSNILKSKFTKLIIPFLIIGLLYLLPIRYSIHYPNYTNNSLLYNIFHNIILGFDNGHLWYLPTLFFMFLIFSLHSSKNNYLNIFTFLILITLNLLSNSLHSYSYLYHICYYSLFFFLGMILKQYNFTNIYPYYYVFIIPAIFFFIPNTTSSILLLILQLLFIITLYQLNFTRLGKIVIIDKIARNSYGIYLLHSPLIYYTFSYLPNVNPVLIIIINFIIFGSLSYLITSLLRKTKLKFIIGE